MFKRAFLGENTCFSIYRVKLLFEVLRSELGSELGNELGCELTSLAGSELGLASYRLIGDYFPVTCERALCPFNFLLASCQVSSRELSLASYRDTLGTIPEGGVLLGQERPHTMTMPNIQLNSKFVNNMSPEWDRFVTPVKLNKGLKETNHEQLYAYLKQHEKHAA
nr:integrase, catalytic region, zinc finger, CCHC-type, peptidase aspartic, catalytic [Tanacetum cinerariifolium]